VRGGYLMQPLPAQARAICLALPVGMAWDTQSWSMYRPVVLYNSVYVPTTAEVEAYQKAQNAHSHAIMDVIGPEVSQRLGIDSMSPVRELKRWQSKASPALVTQLETGLATKKDGLEAMRRERIPIIRMYDVAEYYYKVPDSIFVCCVVCRMFTGDAVEQPRCCKGRGGGRRARRPS
jgi:hypothetical protein